MTRKILDNLRRLLVDKGLSAYVIPSQDAHQSEYIADRDKRRAFVSGFTGSAGTVVVSAHKAWLWTDGRYTLQAKLQLDPECFEVFTTGPGAKSMESYLAETLGKNANVGVDPALYSMRALQNAKRIFDELNLNLVPVDANLVDLIWDDRPALPSAKIFSQPIQYTGRTTEEKLAIVRREMATGGADTLVVSALDEIAWLFNLRGADVTFNPVFFAFAVVSISAVTLYVDETRVTEEALAILKPSVTLRPYDQFIPDLSTAAQTLGVVWLDPVSTSWSVRRAVDSAKNIVEKLSPISLPKAIKTPTELEGFRNCHRRDGAALVKFLHWISSEISAGKIHTEISASDKLEQFRMEVDHYMGLSFDTIAGYGPNGAIIHYRADTDSAATLGNSNLFLVDSGGQYRDGTTDVTRTVHFGEATAEQKRCFTRVLQGHIALSSAKFPPGTSGSRLDALARQWLWKDSLDYKHGTGHGVGSFLNVHEGPHLISYYARDSDPALVDGMIVTIEPGYYREGAFGIRIENVTEILRVSSTDDFLCFKPLTMAPIQKNLIEISLLTAEEVAWIDGYHETVRENLSPLLEPSVRVWLEAQTSPLSPLS